MTTKQDSRAAREFAKIIGGICLTEDWEELFCEVNALKDGEDLERILFYVFGWCEGRNDMIFYRGIESALGKKGEHIA